MEVMYLVRKQQHVSMWQVHVYDIVMTCYVH